MSTRNGSIKIAWSNFKQSLALQTLARRAQHMDVLRIPAVVISAHSTLQPKLPKRVAFFVWWRRPDDKFDWIKFEHGHSFYDHGPKGVRQVAWSKARKGSIKI